MLENVEASDTRPDGIRDHKRYHAGLKCVDKKAYRTEKIQCIIGKTSYAKRPVFVGHKGIQDHKRRAESEYFKWIHSALFYHPQKPLFTQYPDYVHTVALCYIGF
jgi:hypothetical protein